MEGRRLLLNYNTLLPLEWSGATMKDLLSLGQLEEKPRDSSLCTVPPAFYTEEQLPVGFVRCSIKGSYCTVKL